MKAIYWHKMYDTNKVKANLILCLQLDPTIEQIRIELCHLLIKSNYLILTNKSSLTSHQSRRNKGCRGNESEESSQSPKPKSSNGMIFLKFYSFCVVE